MKMYRSPSNSQGDGRQDDKGFTLIEILIAIVLIGILSAVAVVGISNLVSKGGSSACVASKDASTAASAVYFAANNNTYPISFTQLTTGSALIPAALTLPSGVTVNAAVIAAPTAPAVVPPAAAIGMQAASGTSWYLNMTAGVNGAAPTFSCLP